MGKLSVSGKCRTCGREVEGELVGFGTSQAVGACPQCGTQEFYIDFAAPVKKARAAPEVPDTEKKGEAGFAAGGGPASETQAAAGSTTGEAAPTAQAEEGGLAHGD